MMPPREPVTLPFLGSRDYLHGTTLYGEMAKYVPADASVDFRIQSIIRSNRIGLVSDAEDNAAPAARLDWTLGSRGGHLLGIPAEGTTIEREAYDEAAVIARVEVSSETASYAGSLYGLVPTLIPMFKVLLAAGGLAPSGGQWMFTRLEATRAAATYNYVELRLQQARRQMIALAGIDVDGERFGSIFFSWVPHDRSDR